MRGWGYLLVGLLFTFGPLRAGAQGILAELTPSQAHLRGIEIGQPARFKLALKNRGVGVLEVKRVWTSNPGIKAEAEPVPGREGREFKVSVSVELDKPGRFFVYVYAETNDPKRPTLKSLVFGTMIPGEARIEVLTPYALTPENSWLFDRKWVVDVVNPLSEINNKMNKQGYKEHFVLLEMEDLSTSAGYFKIQRIEKDLGEAFRGPSALLAGGKLLQSYAAQRHFVQHLIQGNDYSLATIQRLAAEAAALD